MYIRTRVVQHTSRSTPSKTREQLCKPPYRGHGYLPQYTLQNKGAALQTSIQRTWLEVNLPQYNLQNKEAALQTSIQRTWLEVPNTSSLCIVRKHQLLNISKTIQPVYKGQNS
jgi:hypothetical protein